MGTIREYRKKDGSPTYHAEVRLKGQEPQRACFRTRTQAKQWVQATESAIRDRRYVNVSEARRRTVGDMIGRFIDKWLPKYPERMKKQVAIFWKHSSLRKCDKISYTIGGCTVHQMQGANSQPRPIPQQEFATPQMRCCAPPIV